MMIQGLWDKQVKAIIEVKLGKSDTDSYRYESMTALLDWWETINKDKCDKHCNDQWKHFSRFLFQLMEF